MRLKTRDGSIYIFRHEEINSSARVLRLQTSGWCRELVGDWEGEIRSFARFVISLTSFVRVPDPPGVLVVILLPCCLES